MEEELRFRRESIVEVDAAVVGISSGRWTAISEADASPEHAAQIIKVHRFDVLPIIADAAVKEYFCADAWNTYTAISRKAITHRDVIPFDTRLRDVMRGFALDARRLRWPIWRWSLPSIRRHRQITPTSSACWQR